MRDAYSRFTAQHLLHCTPSAHFGYVCPRSLLMFPSPHAYVSSYGLSNVFLVTGKPQTALDIFIRCLDAFTQADVSASCAAADRLRACVCMCVPVRVRVHHSISEGPLALRWILFCVRFLRGLCSHSLVPRIRIVRRDCLTLLPLTQGAPCFPCSRLSRYRKTCRVDMV